MCLITPIKESFIAEEDMTVYKYLSFNTKSLKANYAQAYHNNYRYNFNELYMTEFSFLDEENFWKCTFISYHYLNKNFKHWEIPNSPVRKNLLCVAGGFHSRINPFDFHTNTFRCTIPKGSVYYKDMSAQLVSNQIIIHGLI